MLFSPSPLTLFLTRATWTWPSHLHPKTLPDNGGGRKCEAPTLKRKTPFLVRIKKKGMSD